MGKMSPDAADRWWKGRIKKEEAQVAPRALTSPDHH
jgi:hypothetical protein